MTTHEARAGIEEAFPPGIWEDAGGNQLMLVSLAETRPYGDIIDDFTGPKAALLYLSVVCVTLPAPGRLITHRLVSVRPHERPATAGFYHLVGDTARFRLVRRFPCAITAMQYALGKTDTGAPDQEAETDRMLGHA